MQSEFLLCLIIINLTIAKNDYFLSKKWNFIMKINEKIKELREQKHWSQEEIAKKMHISSSSYSKIERGETRLTLDRLEQFAEIFDIEIGKLIQSDGDYFYQVNENNGYIYKNSNISQPNEKDYQTEIENALKKLLAVYEKNS